MLSNFQVTVSVWLPEICTVVLAASVRTSAVVEHVATPAVQTATGVNEALLSVPVDPVAFVQVAAFQVTSDAAQVVAPTEGGVKFSAFASSETLNCLVAVASTIRSTVTDALLAAVAVLTLVTANVIPAGTITLACSLTVAVSVVV